MKVVFVGVLATALSASTPAQTVITEQDFVAALDASHPAVVAAAEEAAIARAALIEVRSFDNPVLGVAHEDPDNPAHQTDLTLSWQLPDRNRSLRIETAERELDAAEARLEHALTQLRLDARESYAAWAIAAATRESLARQLERFDALLVRERLRAERGEASGLEVHRLTQTASTLRAEAALAAAGESAARARAAAWIADLPADLQPELPHLPQPSPDEGSHPLLRAAEADIAAAEAAQRAASRYLRSPELMAGWQQQETGDTSLDGPLAGVYWAVPLFRRNQSEKLAARARLDTARGRLEQTRRQIDAERRSARESYQGLAAALREIEQNSATTEQMLRGAEAAFVAGEASLTDLLETWRSAIEAERSRLTLYEASLRALRDLERVTGRNN